MDGLSPHAHALGRRDLVAHEGQQWGNQQRRPLAFLAQQLRGDEIDEALAPSRLLHDQESAAAFDDVADRVFLVVAKSRVWMTGADAKQFECTLRVVNHDGGKRPQRRRLHRLATIVKIGRFCDGAGILTRMALSDRFDRALLLAHRVHRDQQRKGTAVPVPRARGGGRGRHAGVRRDGGSGHRRAPARHAGGHDRHHARGFARHHPRRLRPGRAGHRRRLHGSDVQPKPPWRARKEQYLAHVRDKARPDSLLVSAADKLHNLHALARDYRHEGETLWERFNKEAGKDGGLWYHRALADVFRERLGGTLAGDRSRRDGPGASRPDHVA